MGFIGRKWQGWSGKTSMISKWWFTHLTDELILSFYWCLHDLRPNMLILLVKNTLKEATFVWNCGFDWYKMVRLEWKCITDSHPKVHKLCWWINIEFLLVPPWSTSQHTCVFGQRGVKTSDIWFKLGGSLAENDRVGVETHLWFPTDGSYTLLMSLYWVFVGACMIYNPTCLFFRSKICQKKSNLLQIVSLMGRK